LHFLHFAHLRKLPPFGPFILDFIHRKVEHTVYSTQYEQENCAIAKVTARCALYK